LVCPKLDIEVFVIMYTRTDNHVHNKGIIFNDGILEQRNYYRNTSGCLPGLGPRCINRSIRNRYYCTDASYISFFSDLL